MKYRGVWEKRPSLILAAATSAGSPADVMSDVSITSTVAAESFVATVTATLAMTTWRRSLYLQLKQGGFLPERAAAGRGSKTGWLGPGAARVTARPIPKAGHGWLRPWRCW